MLSEDQVTLIQASFIHVVPKADPIAIKFYDRLFTIRPDFRPMFAEDMTEQRAKLVSTLATVVRGLGDIEDMLPIIQNLGRRHVNYNVKSEDYGPVGEALLWALADALGSEWTEETEKAWAAAYAVLAKVMIDAAAGEAAA